MSVLLFSIMRGGVRATSEHTRGTNTKKNNLTSRRRAANTQPYQPLPVVGLVRAITRHNNQHDKDAGREGSVLRGGNKG
jgi:hypothetical protein